MPAYQHILAAVDLDPHGERVLDHACAMAKIFGARLSVLHVVEFIPMDSGDALMIATPDLNRQLVEQARQQVEALCGRCGLPVESAMVVQGAASGEIKRMAGEKGVDLVVLGHHPRRGLAALFSHTDEHVVQRAPCDVLAVRLPD
ncbi:MAG TPA: universal stress protein [Solimonas sp.]|nr:universal stress protein [Solimonas sp.]